MSDDFETPVQWFPKERFEMAEPVCDQCSIPLTVFPVCVRGSYALCKKCQKGSMINDGDSIYFESQRYRFELEGPNPGVNFGGR